MMSPHSIRLWSAVHTWMSLVCTVFLLMLSLTGLPLVFGHELSEARGYAPIPAPLSAGEPRASVDALVSAAKRAQPGLVVQYLIWEDDAPDVVRVTMAAAADTPPDLTRGVRLDANRAAALERPRGDDALLYVLRKLHVDMFAGLAGMLFLGAMGVVFLAATASGVVIYFPYNRKLRFGTVRVRKSRPIMWLDLHNVIGVVTALWAIVVGATGSVNTLADLAAERWRGEQLTAMRVESVASPSPSFRAAPAASLDAALARARAAVPGMTPAFVAYPGTRYSSDHDYAVFMHGDNPLTARIFTPVLIDAQSGDLRSARPLPWYLKALLATQPFHFGDFGGMPVKLVYAVCDIATIIVLGSGLYLWIARRRWRITDD
jgi:uncharacterized iron-regulated membrane protein